MVFNADGDLFTDSFVGGPITELTQSGRQSIFASGLNHPEGLAFDSSGNLYEVDNGTGNIYEFTPSGSGSTFASGLGTGLAGPHWVIFGPSAVPGKMLNVANTYTVNDGNGGKNYTVNMVTDTTGVIEPTGPLDYHGNY